MDRNYMQALKQQTRLSDYMQATDILDAVTDAGVPIRQAVAYIYRAGVQEGRVMGKRTQKRLGQALTNAHKEIKALREQANNGKLEAILEAVKAVQDPVREVAQEVETW